MVDKERQEKTNKLNIFISHWRILYEFASEVLVLVLDRVEVRRSSTLTKSTEQGYNSVEGRYINSRAREMIHVKNT